MWRIGFAICLPALTVSAALPSPAWAQEKSGCDDPVPAEDRERQCAVLRAGAAARRLAGLLPRPRCRAPGYELRGRFRPRLERQVLHGGLRWFLRYVDSDRPGFANAITLDCAATTRSRPRIRATGHRRD